MRRKFEVRWFADGRSQSEEFDSEAEALAAATSS
jgi:hypothetical protein